MFSSWFGRCTPQMCTPQGCSSCESVVVPREPGGVTLHSESSVPQPTREGSGARRLSVPVVFTRFQFSVIYTQLGATQGTLMEQQKGMLQSILEQFTKDLTRGAALSIVDRDGRSQEYFCRMDAGMTQLTMEHIVSGDPAAMKSLVLHDIERILSPEEVRNLRTTHPLFVDECCTTVVLVGQRFVTLRLDSVPAREYMMLCLQVLRMSQDRAQMWYT